MDENNNIEIKTENKWWKNNCWKKCLLIAFFAFLGGFLATYFVMDQMIEKQFKRHANMFQPKIIERQIFNDFDKIYKKEMKELDRIQKKFENYNNIAMPIQMIDSVKIKSEIDDGNYEITVDLKPFNNDENKIKYAINGKKITVYGNSQVKDNYYEEDISFSQDFLLPKNADTTKIKQIKEFNKLIISIPLI